MERPPGHERGPSWLPRAKVGLETPMTGRFLSEGRRLVFGPPLWYDRLVWACLVGGPAVALTGLFRPLDELALGPTGRAWLGAAVALAGIWALLSHERLLVDTGKREYVRWEGGAPLIRVTRGSLTELDALVLLAEASSMLPPGGVEYRLVLYWKGSRHPLLVVEQESCALPPGAPLNHGAGRLLANGVRYAQALGVRLHDNAHFHSPEPVRPV